MNLFLQYNCFSQSFLKIFQINISIQNYLIMKIKNKKKNKLKVYWIRTHFQLLRLALVFCLDIANACQIFLASVLGLKEV